MIFGFGKYVGTIKNYVGGIWLNPYYEIHSIQLTPHIRDTAMLELNDKSGTPIIIQVKFAWYINNIYKALYDVWDYHEYITIQVAAGVRKLAMSYNYDNIDGEDPGLTLRGSQKKILNSLRKELNERIAVAGLTIMAADIVFLKYSGDVE